MRRWASGFAEFTQILCQRPYVSWAYHNCPAFCGFCPKFKDPVIISLIMTTKWQQTACHSQVVHFLSDDSSSMSWHTREVNGILLLKGRRSEYWSQKPLILAFLYIWKSLNRDVKQKIIGQSHSPLKKYFPQICYRWLIRYVLLDLGF